MEQGTQFTTVTAAEAHRTLSMLHGADYTGEDTPKGGTDLNMPETGRRKNATGKRSNKQNVGSRRVSALQQSMSTTMDGTPIRDDAPTVPSVRENQKRGPKPSIDPRHTDTSRLREIGAEMAEDRWEPEYNVYNDPERSREAGRSSSVFNEDKQIVPSAGTPRVKRNQFGGVSMRTVAGNPALRRQLRLGAGSVTGETNPYDVLDDTLARTGRQQDEWHTPVSQAVDSSTRQERPTSIFEHVQDHGVTDPIVVHGASVPDPVHRMMVAAAHFHDPTQPIRVRHA